MNKIENYFTYKFKLSKYRKTKKIIGGGNFGNNRRKKSCNRSNKK